MSEGKNPRPAFSAPLYAYLRQGGKEFGQVLPAFPGSVQVVNEPGTLGNPTQQMVTDAIEGDQAHQGMLQSYSSRGEKQQDREMVRE